MPHPIIIAHAGMIPHLEPHLGDVARVVSLEVAQRDHLRSHLPLETVAGVWLTASEWAELTQAPPLQLSALSSALSVEISSSASHPHHQVNTSEAHHRWLIQEGSEDTQAWRLLIALQVELLKRITTAQASLLRREEQRDELIEVITSLRVIPNQVRDNQQVRALSLSALKRVEGVRHALGAHADQNAEASSPRSQQLKPLERSSCSLRALVSRELERLICPSAWLEPGDDFEVDVDPACTARGVALLLSLIAQRYNSAKISLSLDAQRADQVILEVSVPAKDNHVNLRDAEPDLSYLRWLAESQNGEFTIRSSISGELSITWRFAEARQVTPTGEAAEPTHHHHSLVWLIDDEATVRLTVKRWLLHLGYQVEVFEEGGALLERLAQMNTPSGQLPALIICDADMPHMSGLEVLGHVAQQTPHVKRLLYTAREPNRWVIESFNQGVIHRFIDKGEGLKALETCLSEMLREREERASQIQALDELLSERLLELHLQPIFNAKTRAVEASEALMRSRHPSFRGPLDILNATQLAQREFDLQRVLTSLNRSVRESLPDHIKLFMNIDPLVFGHPDRLDEIFSEVYPYASTIVLELTERGQLCGDAWVESVSKLRARGFEIALDDLGAGYNSLGAVAAVSPEIIKLDISLISNLHLSNPKREMVRLLSEYAQRHEIKTVAEGIELGEEAAVCTELGIKWLQGYHLERPLPLERYHSTYVQQPDQRG